MSQPTAFAVHDLDRTRAILLRAALAQIVVSSEDTFLATPAPLLLDASGTKLIGHLAKPNNVGRHALASADGVPCIAIFAGVDGYVSPSAYPSKMEHGNYETVQVHGRLRPKLSWRRWNPFCSIRGQQDRCSQPQMQDAMARTAARLRRQHPS